MLFIWPNVHKCFLKRTYSGCCYNVTRCLETTATQTNSPFVSWKFACVTPAAHQTKHRTGTRTHPNCHNPDVKQTHELASKQSPVSTDFQIKSDVSRAATIVRDVFRRRANICGLIKYSKEWRHCLRRNLNLCGNSVTLADLTTSSSTPQRCPRIVDDWRPMIFLHYNNEDVVE